MIQRQLQMRIKNEYLKKDIYLQKRQEIIDHLILK